MVQQGFALQLGLIGMIAEQGGFEGVRGEAERFEYWSLSRDLKARGEIRFGYREEPILEGSRKTGIARSEFIPETARYLVDAIDRWILGAEPFTARLNPDIGGYNDYDQLMRLDEWIAQLGGERVE
jgi:ATP-dependent helicase/nuclease subunit B